MNSTTSPAAALGCGAWGEYTHGHVGDRKYRGWEGYTHGHVGDRKYTVWEEYTHGHVGDRKYRGWEESRTHGDVGDCKLRSWSGWGDCARMPDRGRGVNSVQLVVSGEL